MPRMTAKEAVEKLRKYYYPYGYLTASCKVSSPFSGPIDERLQVEYALMLPAGAGRDIYGADFETCFGVLDRLIAAGKVKSGIPGDTAPEIDPEEYGRINHDDERCLCGQITEDGGLCPECLQVQADHMADLKENR